MNGILKTKINSLLETAPLGQVLTATWLRKEGYSGNLVTLYCNHHWLHPIGHGAYLKVGDTLSWEGAVAALQQQLILPLHIGAQSALALHGIHHFVPFQKKGACQYLLSTKACHLPKWFITHFQDKPFLHIRQRLFTPSTLGLTQVSVSRIPLIVSAPERAVLEMLSLVPSYFNYEHAYYLVEGLFSLVAKELQLLLEVCHSIKVKRLFLHLAEKHQLPCFSQLNLKTIRLGRGKRVIEKGGVYDATYQLSVPKLSHEDIARG